MPADYGQHDTIINHPALSAVGALPGWSGPAAGAVLGGLRGTEHDRGIEGAVRGGLGSLGGQLGGAFAGGAAGAGLGALAGGAYGAGSAMYNNHLGNQKGFLGRLFHDWKDPAEEAGEYAGYGALGTGILSGIAGGHIGGAVGTDLATRKYRETPPLQKESSVIDWDALEKVAYDIPYGAAAGALGGHLATRPEPGILDRFRG